MTGWRADPVPCSCLKRPSRMELKQMLEVLKLSQRARFMLLAEEERGGAGGAWGSEGR